MNNTLFILGNGPSLAQVMNNDKYLSYVKQHDSFCLNNFYKMMNKYNFTPTYYGCFDYVVNENKKKDYSKLVLEENGIKEFYFIGSSNKGQTLYSQEVIDKDRFIKFNFINKGLNKFSEISKTFDYFVNAGASGANALQIGIMKGYKKIILLGCDCNYVERVTGSKVNSSGQLIIENTIENNPNYWFPEYHSNGDTYNFPQMQTFQIEGWKNIHKCCPNDVEILNCSEISKIPFFKKISFDSICKKMLIFTDSRGQHKEKSYFNESKMLFTEKLQTELYKLYKIETDLMLCPFKWTSTLDFIQCVETNVINLEDYDYIILYTGVVEYSPRNLSNLNECYNNTKNEEITFSKLIDNKSKIINNKLSFMKKIFSTCDIKEHFDNYSTITYKNENTNNMISKSMHENIVIPYLKTKLQHKLIFINSNYILEGWEGNYIKINPLGRPKNINIINQYVDLNNTLFYNMIKLDWSGDEIKKYTIDNMHLTYEGSEYIYDKVIKFLQNNIGF
jgi:hypothetical protein